MGKKQNCEELSVIETSVLGDTEFHHIDGSEIFTAASGSALAWSQSLFSYLVVDIQRQ